MDNPENHTPITMYVAEYQVFIDNAPGGKWQGRIRRKGESTNCWTGNPWSERTHAIDQALSAVALGKVDGKGVLGKQMSMLD